MRRDKKCIFFIGKVKKIYEGDSIFLFYYSQITLKHNVCTLHETSSVIGNDNTQTEKKLVTIVGGVDEGEGETT